MVTPTMLVNYYSQSGLEAGEERMEEDFLVARPFVDDADLIKVVAGIRRCGKSCLVEAVADEPRERGIVRDAPVLEM